MAEGTISNCLIHSLFPTTIIRTGKYTTFARWRRNERTVTTLHLHRLNLPHFASYLTKRQEAKRRKGNVPPLRDSPTHSRNAIQPRGVKSIKHKLETYRIDTKLIQELIESASKYKSSSWNAKWNLQIYKRRYQTCLITRQHSTFLFV